MAEGSAGGNAGQVAESGFSKSGREWRLKVRVQQENRGAEPLRGWHPHTSRPGSHSLFTTLIILFLVYVHVNLGTKDKAVSGNQVWWPRLPPVSDSTHFGIRSKIGPS